MPTIAKTASAAAVALLRQATALWPKRSRSSDGLLPSKAHIAQNPNSDHNTGLAVDITHDPKHGVDCSELFDKLQHDPRVLYLIFNRRIWVDKKGEKKYSGANPHTKHLHVSIKSNYASNTSPWFPWAGTASLTGKVASKLSGKPKKKTSTSPKEDA
jgi:hypothetical protein